MWTKQQAKKFHVPNYSKEYVRKPVILQAIGDIKKKKIIELGCGSGYWMRIFAKKGALCTGIELNKNQIALAIQEEKKQPLGIEYFQKNAVNLSGVKSDSFDIVFIEYVLLEIPKKTVLAKIFKESFRVLKKGGFIFISDMHPFHPLFDKRTILPKNFHYYQSGSKIKVPATGINGKKITFTDYHWTLEDMISSLSDTGFMIKSIREPRPNKRTLKKYPYLEHRAKYTPDIMIIARKV
ncbi:MAG: class I SAM-dependent methyltransferase [Candidatus Woesearchaeota archaeon]